ncbi:hypothetical protein PENTCL1PPCAC_24377, partial [Pristionchus entomophagus]
IFRMAGTSNFVLRWEIDNPSAVFIAKHAISNVFREGGFEWTIGLRSNEANSNAADATVSCHNEACAVWRCEADVTVLLRASNAELDWKKKNTFKFYQSESVKIFTSLMNWVHLTANPTSPFNINGKFIIEVSIKIISSEILESTPIFDLSKFASQNEASNVTLVIGDYKLLVSKEYLSMYSPVFAAMFFGEYDEKNKKEIDINEVEYEEFIDLLLVIFPTRAKINDSTVHHVLALGDRFQIDTSRVEAETHLLSSTNFSTVEKLMLADQYRLQKLRNNCLLKYTNLREIGTLESTPEYANFTDSMKASICDRMMMLVKTMN